MVAVSGRQIADNLVGMDDLATSRYRRSRVKSILWLDEKDLPAKAVSHPERWHDPMQQEARTAFSERAKSRASSRDKASKNAKWALDCPNCSKTCATYLRKPKVGDKYCMSCTKEVARNEGRNPGPRRNRVFDERTRLLLRQLR